MEERVKDLIYLDSDRYISIHSLRVLYWTISIVPFMMIAWGIGAINTIGLNWMSLFPLISTAVWSLLYWTLVLTVQRKKTKKTFELRFLVNGFSGLLLSSLFWILYSSFSLLDSNPFWNFDFLLCILLFYLLSSILYIGLVILGVHKGIFKKIKEKSRTPKAKALAITAFFTSALPVAGVLGMYASSVLRAHANAVAQDFVGIFALITMIFLPILAHINFVQYFYCKKYKVHCDEYGNTTSPMLECHKKEKRNKAKQEEAGFKQTNISKGKPSKKGVPLLIKILMGALCIPVILTFFVFLIFCIKEFIQGIS